MLFVASMNRINPVSAHSAYLARRHIGSLDGIRAAAILAVIWHHTTTPIGWLPMTARGFLGVDFFFALSGFLIVMLLLRERDRNGDISLKNFYMRRTLRIFPVYYGLLFVLMIVFGLIARNSETGAEILRWMPFYLTYTSNFVNDETLLTVAWSLATEEQFYLVWPPLEKFIGRFTYPILAILLIINQLINYEIILAEQHARLEVLQSTFTPILLGVLLAHLLHKKASYDALAKLFSNRWMTAVFVVVLLILLNIFPVGSDISGTPRLLIHIAMLGFLASCVLQENHVLKPAMSVAPLVRIGQISYGMYLFHMFVVAVGSAVLGRLGLSGLPLVLFVGTLIGTIIVAELSFRFYETPFNKLKHRWSATKTASVKAKTPSEEAKAITQ